MARSHQLRLAQVAPPAVAMAVILAAMALGVVPLLLFGLQQGGFIRLDQTVFAVLQFTVLQAGLSTLLSVFPALFIARALVRQRFVGRGAIEALLNITLSLPAIVAVLGLATIYGANGWLAGSFPFYGLGGIVLAHVFFNLPLSTRFFVEALHGVAPENYRLAAQLGFASGDTWHHVDWPALRPILPRVAALVFLLCAGSFVIVLTLGGPSATTLEVAIYHALRMDFDVPRALSLSLLQIMISGVLVMLAGRFAQLSPMGTTIRHSERRWDGRSPLARIVDGLMIAAIVTLVLPPLAAVATEGVAHLGVIRGSGFWRAMSSSLLLGLISALLTLLLAWPLANLQGRASSWATLANLFTLAGLIIPPAVLATGWFLVARHVDGGMPMTFLLVAALNALMSLPFASTVLIPAIARSRSDHDRLCAQLGIRGWTRWKLIDGPALKRPIMQALLMAFTLSLGDLAAITLLGTQDMTTLPSLIARQMGNYRSSDAHGTALVLLMLCLLSGQLANMLRNKT